jgi:hypothetical protein
MDELERIWKEEILACSRAWRNSPCCPCRDSNRAGIDKYKAPGRHAPENFYQAPEFSNSVLKNIYMYPVLINKLHVLRSHFNMCSFILVLFVFF